MDLEHVATWPGIATVSGSSQQAPESSRGGCMKCGVDPALGCTLGCVACLPVPRASAVHPGLQVRGPECPRGDLPHHGTKKGPKRGTEHSLPERALCRVAAGGCSGGDGPALGRGGDLPGIAVPSHTCFTHEVRKQGHGETSSLVISRTGVEAKCQRSVTGDWAVVHLVSF